MALPMQQVHSSQYDIIVHTDKGMGVYHEYTLQGVLNSVKEFSAIASKVEVAHKGEVIATFIH